MGVFLKQIAESGIDEEIKSRRRHEHPKKRTLRKRMRRIRLEKATRLLKADSPQYLNVNPDYRFVGLRTVYEKLLFADIVPYTPNDEEYRKQQRKKLQKQVFEEYVYTTDSVLRSTERR